MEWFCVDGNAGHRLQTCDILIPGNRNIMGVPLYGRYSFLQNLISQYGWLLAVQAARTAAPAYLPRAIPIMDHMALAIA
jgi:hypothetical protein